jgi:hypothetical protein
MPTCFDHKCSRCFEHLRTNWENRGQWPPHCQWYLVWCRGSSGWRQHQRGNWQGWMLDWAIYAQKWGECFKSHVIFMLSMILIITLAIWIGQKWCVNFMYCATKFTTTLYKIHEWSLLWYLLTEFISDTNLIHDLFKSWEILEFSREPIALGTKCTQPSSMVHLGSWAIVHHICKFNTNDNIFF